MILFCRRLYPDLAFFQAATDYPCKRLTKSTNGLTNLRKRVENTFLESHNVSQNRLGITQVHEINKFIQYMDYPYAAGRPLPVIEQT